MSHRTKDQAVLRFRQAFARKFGTRAEFYHQKADSSGQVEERIDVRVHFSDFPWQDVKPAVEDLLQSSGAYQYFDICGSGTDFVFRDVSLCRN